jgi:hypothetical protein
MCTYYWSDSSQLHPRYLLARLQSCIGDFNNYSSEFSEILVRLDGVRVLVSDTTVA